MVVEQKVTSKAPLKIKSYLLGPILNMKNFQEGLGFPLWFCFKAAGDLYDMKLVTTYFKLWRTRLRYSNKPGTYSAITMASGYRDWYRSYSNALLKLILGDK